jgi:hypothetical protein
MSRSGWVYSGKRSLRSSELMYRLWGIMTSLRTLLGLLKRVTYFLLLFKFGSTVTAAFVGRARASALS